jgi:type IV pilus assembly protein PilN
MPRINLLPVKQARKRDTAKNELLLVVCTILLVLFGLYSWYGHNEDQITWLEDRLKRVETDISSLDLDVAKVKDFKAKQQTIEKKLEVIDKLIAQKIGPALMLDELATILTRDAKKVWITSLGESEGKLKLAGGAMSHEDISEFQLALERGKYFDKVTLGSVRAKKDGDITYLEWELSCSTSYKRS